MWVDVLHSRTTHSDHFIVWPDKCLIIRWGKIGIADMLQWFCETCIDKINGILQVMCDFRTTTWVAAERSFLQPCLWCLCARFLHACTEANTLQRLNIYSSFLKLWLRLASDHIHCIQTPTNVSGHRRLLPLDTLKQYNCAPAIKMCVLCAGEGPRPKFLAVYFYNCFNHAFETMRPCTASKLRYQFGIIGQCAL